MDRVGLVFVLCVMLAVVISLAGRAPEAQIRVQLKQIDYSTPLVFNVAALGVVAILAVLYAVFW